MRNGDASFWLTVLVIVAFFLIVVVSCTAEVKCSNACLRFGWRDSKMTYPDLGCYCVREENEYEIVKPLWELR